MEAAGFDSVFVLTGGLDAWKGAGFDALPVDTDEVPCSAGEGEEQDDLEATAHHPNAFLPGLVENYANRHQLPLKRQLAILFVDIADSTPEIVGRAPEEALAYVQRFMGHVTQAALDYCGDVKDYEGDGALLYFESVTEAAQAAFAIRKALADDAERSGDALRVRLSLDAGDVVIGVIGTALRRSVALIGPCINRAARLLKEVPPDRIIATDCFLTAVRAETSEVADRFDLLDERLELKGFDREVVTAFTA